MPKFFYVTDGAYVVDQGVLEETYEQKPARCSSKSREGWAGRNIGQLGASPPMIPRLRRMEEREGQRGVVGHAEIFYAAVMDKTPDKAGRVASVAPQMWVLVHGAWHGGWCWRRVAEALRAAGDVVFRTDADRPRRASPSVAAWIND